MPPTSHKRSAFLFGSHAGTHTHSPFRIPATVTRAASSLLAVLHPQRWVHDYFCLDPEKSSGERNRKHERKMRGRWGVFGPLCQQNHIQPTYCLSGIQSYKRSRWSAGFGLKKQRASWLLVARQRSNEEVMTHYRCTSDDDIELTGLRSFARLLSVHVVHPLGCRSHPHEWFWLIKTGIYFWVLDVNQAAAWEGYSSVYFVLRTCTVQAVNPEYFWRVSIRIISMIHLTIYTVGVKLTH